MNTNYAFFKTASIDPLQRGDIVRGNGGRNWLVRQVVNQSRDANLIEYFLIVSVSKSKSDPATEIKGALAVLPNHRKEELR